MSNNATPKFKNQVYAGNGNQTEAEALFSLSPPTDLTVPSFLVTLLFNHVLGFIAYYFTVSARRNWQQNNYPKSKQHTRYSTILLVVGFLIGIATYVVAIILYFILKSDGSCSPTAGTTSTQVQTTTTSFRNNRV